MPKKFPFYKQLDTMDCGPTCVRIIADHYGRKYSLQKLRELSYSDREGVSALGISECAEAIGFETMAVKVDFQGEGEDPDFFDLPTPFIGHWDHYHFLVVYKSDKKYVYVSDPAFGLTKMTHKKFKKGWATDGEQGIAVLLEPGPEFYEHPEEKIERSSMKFLYQFAKPYPKLWFQLLIGVIIGIFISLIFPFLTQGIVDIGIQNNDLNFIKLILLGQLVLFVSQVGVQYIQNWLLLHIGARVNVRLLYHFLTKLMRLPIAFFDSKMTGDLVQRVLDHRRIEVFLTTSTLGIVFSVSSILIFGLILWYYHTTIFLIFLICSILYFGWIYVWLGKRKTVDHLLFRERSENHQILIELIQGMQEIKLQRSEYKRKWYWVHVQARLFRANIKSLAVTQVQEAGATFFSQIKDIFIIFIAARSVLNGSMTLGMMLAIQFIIGQLNAPLRQMIVFIRAWQDARISLERLAEIHNMKDEEENREGKISVLPDQKDFHLHQVDFRYNELSENVLKNINLTIPQGKVTAIVGTSGSGKTTLVKLLLGFYQPSAGNIKVGQTPLTNISSSFWRSKCGAVMQDGYIFSDSIANNIAESEDVVNKEKLLRSVKIANIQEFVESLPLGYNTKIGKTGNGLSRGQTQRLLIARAVYKNPEFLFFDEATNALDANNEKVIVENLNQFFEGKTVVVVAHRLSTVRDADQIIVLEKGELIEKGTHEELTMKRGAYFNLVKNQLELGS